MFSDPSISTLHGPTVTSPPVCATTSPVRSPAASDVVEQSAEDGGPDPHRQGAADREPPAPGRHRVGELEVEDVGHPAGGGAVHRIQGPAVHLVGRRPPAAGRSPRSTRPPAAARSDGPTPIRSQRGGRQPDAVQILRDEHGCDARQRSLQQVLVRSVGPQSVPETESGEHLPRAHRLAGRSAPAIRSAASAADPVCDRSIRCRAVAHCDRCTCPSRRPGSRVAPAPSMTTAGSAAESSAAGTISATRPAWIRTSTGRPPGPSRTPRRSRSGDMAPPQGAPGPRGSGPVPVGGRVPDPRR